MPHAVSVSAVVDELRSYPGSRALIVQDDQTNTLNYGFFHYPYDRDSSLVACLHLFDSTRALLAASPPFLHDVAIMPIVEYIGRYRVTLLHRALDAHVRLSDAEQTNPDHYIGVE